MHLRTAHIATIVVGSALVIATGFALVTKTRTTSVSADAPVGTASLAVESKSVKVGDQFSVNINLSTGSNAGNNETTGTDVVLAYNRDLLEPVDADPTAPGIQILPGKLFELVQANKANTTLGEIDFSAGQQPTSKGVVATDGLLATVTFKAKAAGRSPLKFIYTAGAVNDSNVIQPTTGRDLLNHVQDGVVTIN